MRATKNMFSLLLAGIILCASLPTGVMAANRENLDRTNVFTDSDFDEREQPELTEETKQLISLYQKDPSQENYLNLRDMVIANYDAVIVRKETKLAELKEETAGKPGGEAIVAEMEEILQDMYITYWSRINMNMLRFTDPRLLKWKTSAASRYEYIPVMGAGVSIYVKRTPVTNSEYAEFLTDSGYPAPPNWENGTYPAGEENYPVNFVSYKDAQAYSEWLTAKDGVNSYRLPTESEWELAAGHMPKDADFNNGVNDGRTPVEEYADVTRGAHGAIDFWGNVWEWTSAQRSAINGETILGVKGGSWASDRTECRTENRKEGRDANAGFADVGFRVIQVLKAKEPQRKVELSTLDFPVVSATSTDNSITLHWEPVAEAVNYQIFEVNEEASLLYMLSSTKDTSITFTGMETGATYMYIVQPVSYTQVADNVSLENSVAVTVGQDQGTQTQPTKIISASSTAEGEPSSTNAEITDSEPSNIATQTIVGGIIAAAAGFGILLKKL